MARLGDILQRRFPPVGGEQIYFGMRYGAPDGTPFTAQQQYDSIQWNPSYPNALPTLAELQALEASVDVDIAAEAVQRQDYKKLLAQRPDALLDALEVLTDAVIQIAQKAAPGTFTTPLDGTRVTALRSKLNQIRPQ